MGAAQSTGGATTAETVTWQAFLEVVEGATGGVDALARFPGLSDGGRCGITVSTTGVTMDAVSAGIILGVIIGGVNLESPRQVTLSVRARRESDTQTTVQLTAQPHLALNTAMVNASIDGRERAEDFWTPVARFPAEGLHGALAGMRYITSVVNKSDTCLPVDTHMHYSRLCQMAQTLLTRANALMDLFGCQVFVVNPSGQEERVDVGAMMRQTPITPYAFVRETCPMCSDVGDNTLDKLAVIRDGDTDDPLVPATFTIHSLYAFLVAHGPVVRILAGYRTV